MFEMQKLCPLQCSNKKYGVISHCQMFSITCMNRNRKVTLLYKSWRYEEKRSRKKGKVKGEEERENEKTMKKGKRSRKTRKKLSYKAGQSANSIAVSSGMAHRAKCFTS
jgi:hypothetical protein